MFATTISNSNDSNKISSLSEAEWVECQSIQHLILRRELSPLAVAAMMLMAVLLYGEIPLWMALTWLLAPVTFTLLLYRNRLQFSRGYSTMSLIEKRHYLHRTTWLATLLALSWGVSGWVFFSQAPVHKQYLSAIILSAIAFMSVLNIGSEPKTAHRFIHVFLGAQVLGAAWHIAINQNFFAPSLQYLHLFGLLLSWILFTILIKRNYHIYRHNLSLQYRNTRLIQSLEHQNERLANEMNAVMQANDTIKRFYSSAAHDIRQPVYALNVYADFIRNDPSSVNVIAPKIQASCEGIFALFNSLFEFEKIKTGQINVAYETVDLVKLFSDLYTQYAPLATAKKLDFRILMPTGYIESDTALVHGLLSHLLSNAIKYTAKGGVLLAMRKRATHISFEVWDTGIGIAREDQDHVYDEFYKVGEHCSANEGFGLGLSVVKRLAAFVEGSSITLQSKLGRGTVFKFNVPIAIYDLNPHQLQTIESSPDYSI